jgi:hypothetical protein
MTRREGPMLRHSLLAALALVSCTTRDPAWNKPFDVTGPLAAGGRLVWLNRSLGRVVALDPTGAAPPLSVPVGLRPRAFAATPSGVVVTGGRGDAPVVHVVSLPAGDDRTFTVAGAYDHAAVSGDGRFAVLFYDPTATPAAGGPAARNNDEISIADLAAGTSTAVALRTEALAPAFVVFSPASDTAAVVLDAAVAVVRLAEPADHVLIPLKLPTGSTLHPREVLFSPDGAFVYVRTQETDDVLAIAIDRTGPRLGASINFLLFPGVHGIADIAVPAGTEFTGSVAALYDDPAGAVVALLDATGDTSRTRSVRFSQRATRLSDLGGGALLVHSDVADHLRFVGGWMPAVDRSDEDQLPGTLGQSPLVGPGAAWFVHPAVGTALNTSAALTRVTLDDDGARLRVRMAPVILGGTATALALDPASGSLVASVRIPREDSGAGPSLADATDFTGTVGSLVIVRPGDLALSGLAVDEDVDTLGFVGPFLFALHPSSLGDVTFVPMTKLARTEARRTQGYLAAGLLDRGTEVSP